MIDVSEIAVSVMLLVMFVLGMWTQRLLTRDDVWTTVRHWWYTRGR